MGFESVRFYNFRNIQNAVVPTKSSNVFFIGKNGQGKTNFLEAVYFLCYGSSFRTNKEKQIIKTGCENFALDGILHTNPVKDIEIKIRYQNTRKEIQVDNTRVTDRKEIIHIAPCILFSHGDINFINGAPERRRWFFNQTISLFDGTVVDILRKYKKLLKMRNNLLKENNTDYLDIITSQLIALGIEVVNYRLDAVEKFNKIFSPVFKHISSLEQNLFIDYKPSWKKNADADEIKAFFRSRIQKEKDYGITTSGPHRDDFIFNYGGSDFSQFASTGQTRLMSLIIRLSQALFFSQQTGRKPVLLMDDVLLELDKAKRRAFIQHLPEYEQAFFTFLPDERYDVYKNNDTIQYTVEDGRFIKT